MNYPHPGQSLPGLAPLPRGWDTPGAFPANPIPCPSTEIGKEATALYDAARVAGGRIKECRDAQTESAHAVAEARAALAEEADRGGREGRNVERELEIARELQARLHLADPSIHERRWRSALEAQQQSVRQWKHFVAAHRDELIAGELEAEAVRAAEQLAEARAKLRPVEEAHRDIAQRMYDLANANTAPGGQAVEVAGEPFPALPLEYAPESEPAEPELDELAEVTA